MAAAQRAIPSHLRDGAATNGGEAGALKRNHHQKSQSHMVSLQVPEKLAVLHTHCRKRESEVVPFPVEGRRCGWSRPLLEEVATGSTLKPAAMTSDPNTSFCTVYSSACEYKRYFIPCIIRVSGSILIGATLYSVECLISSVLEP
jgi:hypothetical protein